MSNEFKEIKNQIAINHLPEVETLSELQDFIRIFPQVLDGLPEDYLLLLLSNKNLALREKLILIIIFTIKLRYQREASELLDYMLLLKDDASNEQLENIEHASIFLYLYFYEILISEYKGYNLDEFSLFQVFGKERFDQDFKFTPISDYQHYPDNSQPDRIVSTIIDWTNDGSAEFSTYFNQILNMFRLDVPKFSNKILSRFLYLLGKSDAQYIPILISILPDVEYQFNSDLDNWMSSLGKVLPHFDEYITEDNLQVLEDMMTSSRASIRIATTICLWIITDDLTLIKKGLQKTSTQKEKNVYNRILKQPEKKKKRYIFNPKPSLRSLKAKLDSLSIPTVINDNNLVYLFSFSNRQKLAAIRGDQTLAQLHSIIIDYFDLESMHLYGFYMDNTTSSVQAPYSNPGTDGPSADEVTISQLDLYLDQKFFLIHDYGDYNKIKLEFTDTIDPEDIDVELPTIISKTKL